MTYFIFFFILQKIVKLKDCVDFQHIKQLRFIQQCQTVKEKEAEWIYNIQSSITFFLLTQSEAFLLEMARCRQIQTGVIFLLDSINNMQLLCISQFIYS